MLAQCVLLVIAALLPKSVKGLAAADITDGTCSEESSLLQKSTSQRAALHGEQVLQEGLPNKSDSLYVMGYGSLFCCLHG